jgi:hypothetical protein
VLSLSRRGTNEDAAAAATHAEGVGEGSSSSSQPPLVAAADTSGDSSSTTAAAAAAADADAAADLPLAGRSDLSEGECTELLLRLFTHLRIISMDPRPEVGARVRGCVGACAVGMAQGCWHAGSRHACLLAAVARHPRAPRHAPRHHTAPQVRNSGVRTLFLAVGSQAGRFGPTTWRYCLWEVLFPLVTYVHLMGDTSSSAEAAAVELGRERGKAVMMLVHHSRNSEQKQWCVRLRACGGARTRLFMWPPAVSAQRMHGCAATKIIGVRQADSNTHTPIHAHAHAQLAKQGRDYSAGLQRPGQGPEGKPGHSHGPARVQRQVGRCVPHRGAVARLWPPQRRRRGGAAADRYPAGERQRARRLR